MPTARLEPTQILVKHIYENWVEKLQLRPLIRKGYKYQCGLDPISFSRISDPLL